MTEIQALINKRGNVKGRLTRVSNTVRNFKDGDNIFQLKTRIPYLESLLKEFNEVQMHIENLDAESTDKDGQVKFETLYFDTLSEIHTLIENNSPSNSSSGTTNAISRSSGSVSDSVLNIKLPTLSLPKFSGSYAEWSSFYDTFNSLIHHNDKLNDCERFHYLKSCLKNEPLHAVEALSVSEANYASALQILTKRYENKRLIVQEHISNILNFPVMNKPSHTSLRQLLDKVTSNLEALKIINLPVESWDALIVPIISEKLDYTTKRDWQTTLNSEIPKLTDLTNFLEKRAEILGSVDAIAKPQGVNKGFFATNKANSQINTFRQTAHVATNKASCVVCQKASHHIYRCHQFLNCSVPERINHVERFSLCKLCLRSSHTTSECKSNGSCSQCNQKHNRLLHQNQPTHTENSAHVENEPSTTTVSNHSSRMIAGDIVLLSTAIIYIKDNKGNLQECCALLDGGSQSCFITSTMCRRLGLQVSPINISIAGINQNSSVATKSARVTIKSRFNNFSAKLTCLVLPKITESLPVQTFHSNYVEVPTNIKLADPKFNESKEIDLLLGAELFWQLLCVGQVQIARSQPTFQKTHLGWVVGGNLSLSAQMQTTYCNLATSAIKQLEVGLSKFWELEQYPSRRHLSTEERQAEKHFRETCTSDANGRLVASLLFKQEPPTLGSSYEIALRRFYNLENRLSRNPELKLEYSAFINEYLNLNHMEQVPQGELNAPSCYLPHHGVVKKDSTTTKLRVVFDASCKTSNGLSLNDNLINGPVIQQDLFQILTRFRTFQYVLSGDITKMYRQIKIHPSQVDYQRIIWRNNPKEPIQVYRLTTLTYGTKPASFIATRCLQELTNQNQQKFPRTSEIIARDFFMDDLLSGANSIRELINIREEITEILASGGFELRKFCSNNRQVLPEVCSENTNHIVNLDKNGETKTLGLLWNCLEDHLKYHVKTTTAPNKVTKRSILSAVAQIFDPLGLLGPVTMKAKIILQQIWSLKLDWDESVPISIHSSWTTLFSQLHYLNDLRIERKVIASPHTARIELHGFCDASQQGYGAAIYIRCKDNNNTYSARLLCAKSRVAPLKTISIPRLELCAALLLVKLAQSLIPTLNLTINRQYLWTDSTIVIAWLAQCPSTLNTFVANRVAEIQALTSITEWIHVKSEDNPADIISRGQLPEELLNSNLWFYGPSWLNEAGDLPQSSLNINNVDVIEKRKVVLASINKSHLDKLPFLIKYSKFYKLQRLILRNCIKCFRVQPRIVVQKMSGLWEINIKSVKRHLSRDLGDALLSYEEMYTLLARTEACLNSRPLTPLSSDPTDLAALTPGHFLIGAPLTALVEEDIMETKSNRLSRWQYVEKLRQHFWKRWHREYLLQLQKRSKWQQESPNIKIGKMVVVVEDGVPPQQWLLGRIAELCPGADGITRVVIVKTVRGLCKRAVNRVCVLPDESEQS